MGDRTPRRSMVGAPPTARGTGTKLTLKIAGRTPAKRKADEEVNEDSVEDSGSDQDSASEDASKSPAKSGRKKRRRMDNSQKAKRKAERRAETQKKKKEEAEARKNAPEPEPESEEDSEEEEEEPEPIVKKGSLTQYSAHQLVFDHLLRKLMNKDKEEYFHNPVTETIAPDYHIIVKTPMDMQSMRQKIEANEYTTINDFKNDAKLIVTNAMRYNAPNTVYHVGAQKLAQVIEYYTSDLYLRDCSQRLPFAAAVNWPAIGLLPPDQIIRDYTNKRREVIGDELTAEDILQSVSEADRKRLAPHRATAPKLATLTKVDGTFELNVIGESDSKGPRIIDLVGSLEEGTPGVFAPSRYLVFGMSPITYQNYGPYCSFAPQFDSTWATMNKKESDLLLRVYGDKPNATEAMGLRTFVEDAPCSLKIVDEILDHCTANEHAQAMKVLEKKWAPSPEVSDWNELLQDIESLTNVGIDMSFVKDLRTSMNGPPPASTPAARLAHTGQALADLAHLQRQRLNQPPPVTLSRVPQPSQAERELAHMVVHHIAQNVSKVEPKEMVSAPVLHDAMGMGNMDDDILSEFFTGL